METLLQDLRYATRTLLKSRGFTAVAVLTLGLAIGAITAVFSVVNAVLLRPLPYRDPEHLAVLWNSYAVEGLDRAAISPPEFADFRAQLPELESISAMADQAVNLTGAGAPERLSAFRVSPNLFATLGVQPLIGRSFLPEEGAEGHDDVVVLSHDLWRRRFGSDSALLGNTIQLNGRAYTVIGVTPPGIRFPDAPGFLFPERAELWIPRSWERFEDGRGSQYLRVVARRKQGVTPQRQQAVLDALAARFRADYPDRYTASSGWKLVSVPLREQVVGDARPALLVLFGAVGLVLLIACANVANLMLARASARQKEVAIRAALGAGRARLVRQLLTESLVLAVAGAGLGLMLALWGIGMLVALGPQGIPRLETASVDARVLGFTLGVSLFSGLLFGIIPALQHARLGRTGVPTHYGVGGADGPRRQRVRGALVVGEIAIALVVLVAAGLLVRSLILLQRVDPGFHAQGVLTLQVSLPSAKYAEDFQTAAFYDELMRRLSALPGVHAAGAANPLPLTGAGWGASFLVAGKQVAPGEPEPHAEHAVATPEYFRALSIPLRAGRLFTDRDDLDAPAVVIVDDLLARRYWPGQNPIGKRLSVAGAPDSVLTTVVGVVGHVRNAGLHIGGEPQIYIPFAQMPHRSMYVAIRGAEDPLRLASAVRREVTAIDRNQPIANVRTMDQLLADATARQRFNLLLLSVFAMTALMLAAVGIYAVMAYTVSQRIREIGIRMALGARAGEVLRQVVGRAMRLVLLGVAVGLAAALTGSPVIEALLFGVGANDLATYASISALLGAVALLACLVPALRAARVDPLVALRHE